MPHKAQWYIPNRLVFIRLNGDFDFRDFDALNQDLKSMLDAGEKPIHMIFDDSGVDKIPTQLSEVENALEFNRHLSLGWMVSVGEASPLVNYMIPMVTKITGAKFLRVDTFEEALAFIKKHDPSIAVTSD